MGIQIKRQLNKTKNKSSQTSLEPEQKEEWEDLFESFEGEEEGGGGETLDSDQCPNCHQRPVKITVDKTSASTIHRLRCKKCGWMEVY